MNYESIRATALLKYTQAAGAIWGCVKPTTKTNLFIQLRMYSSELPVFSLSCRLSLNWLQVFAQIHLRAMNLSLHWSKEDWVAALPRPAELRAAAADEDAAVQNILALIWLALTAVDFASGSKFYNATWLPFTNTNLHTGWPGWLFLNDSCR